MTQMDDARKGIITEQMKAVAKIENVDEEFIRKSVAQGTIAIPNNVGRDVKPVGIGAGLRTKVNATIGTSTDINDMDMEVKKAMIAMENKADTLMELSVGGDLDAIRRKILSITDSVSYTHLRAHETVLDLVCRLLLEKKKKKKHKINYFFFVFFFNDTATTEIYTRKIVGSVRCV